MPYSYLIPYPIVILYNFYILFSRAYYEDMQDTLNSKHKEEYKEIKVNSQYVDNLWDLIVLSKQVARTREAKFEIFKMSYVESYNNLLGKEKLTPRKFVENIEYYTELFDKHIEDLEKTILGNFIPQKKVK